MQNSEPQRSLLSQANTAFTQGHYQQALQLYQEVKQQSPELVSQIAINIRIAQRKLQQQAAQSAILTLDELQHYKLHGWALSPGGQAVTIQVSINNQPVALTSTGMLREDVQQVHGGDGLSGFEFRLNPYLAFTANPVISLSSPSHQLAEGTLQLAQTPWQPLLKGKHFTDVDTRAQQALQRFIYPYTALSDDNADLAISALPAVSIIIVVQNQAEALEACLSSLQLCAPEIGAAEIIVVDCASTDNTAAVLHLQAQPNLQHLKAPATCSYATAVNLALAKASGEVLVFIDANIRLAPGAISALNTQLAHGPFAILGLALSSLPPQAELVDSLSTEVSLTSVAAGANTALPLSQWAWHFSGLAREQLIDPFVLSNSALYSGSEGILQVPALSHYCVAISKANLALVKGFCEALAAPAAVLDLCFRWQQQQPAKLLGVLQHTRAQLNLASTAKMQATQSILATDSAGPVAVTPHNAWFRQALRQAHFKQPGLWNHKPLTVAMVVSEVSLTTDKADFFTAKELGDALEQNPVLSVGYLDSRSGYDLSGYDIVIVYTHDIDPRQFSHLQPHCLLIAWARNWFDSWCDQPWIEHYDLVYASSVKAQRYMQQRLTRQVGLLRIAAAASCLKPAQPQAQLQSDYVFTGSYFHSPREITTALKPADIPFRFKLFGHNWQALPDFGQYSSGPVAYTDIPAVYASTRLVVDDANIATKKWGALNCRVYDALAAGVPCITNNTLGVAELFEADFPVYGGDNLNQQVTALLKDEPYRRQLAQKYQQIVRAEHTYLQRAAQLMTDVLGYVAKTKIALKIAPPNEAYDLTGDDYFFAIALRQALEQAGYAVRIDFMPQWYTTRALNDDINLALRGAARFKPPAGQCNLLWLISHPGEVSEAELRDYQHIFVASNDFSAKLRVLSGLDNITSLYPAAAVNAALLEPDILAQIPQHEILFIGRASNEYCDALHWCVEQGLPLAVYGADWQQFIPADFIKGECLPHHLLPYYYAKAKVVICDLAADMTRHGFVSKQVFDVLAVGGVVLSNNTSCDELANCNNYFIYDNKTSFLSQLQKILLQTGRITAEMGDVSFEKRVAYLQAFLNKDAINRD